MIILIIVSILTLERMESTMKSKNNIDIALTTTEGSKRSIINIDTNKIIDLSSMIASKFNLFGRNSPTLGSLPCDIIMK